MPNLLLLLALVLVPTYSQAAPKAPKKKPVPQLVLTCTSKDKPFDCLACNTYLEGGFESDYGQRLIAYTTLNRAEMKYRNKRQACDIVWDNAQYSWTNGMKGKKTVKLIGERAIAVWERAKKNTRIALYASIRPQRNSFENCITHYYATYIPVPEWSSGDQHLFRAGKIGKHIFYADSRLNPYSDCRPQAVLEGVRLAFWRFENGERKIEGTQLSELGEVPMGFADFKN